MTKASQQYRLIILACGASLACAAPTMAAMVELQADLKASNEVPPNESTGTGSVTATFDTDSNKLSWKGAVSGLSGQVTAANFHAAEAGRNGAVEFLKSEKLHDILCLITDLQMPGLSGLDRLIAEGPRIPIILITGHRDDRTCRLQRFPKLPALLVEEKNGRLREPAVSKSRAISTLVLSPLVGQADATNHELM